MNVLKKVGKVVAVLVLLGGIAWLFRGDPFFMISGRELSGESAPYPKDWSFSDDYRTIAVETRPDDPHSVTTLCFVHKGMLYVPAQAGSKKQWPQFVLEDPRVRLKIGEKIYYAKAERVLPLELADYAESVAAKYPEIGDRPPDEFPDDIWLFRIRPMIN